MSKHIFLAISLFILIVVGIFHRFSPSQSTTFLAAEYDQNDWITTENTIYKKALGESSYLNTNYESLPKGIEVKPILRYDANNVIVELPDGRRVIVVASTLSGLKVGDYIYHHPSSSRKLSDADKAKYSRFSKENSDSTMVCLGFMSPSYYYSKYESRSSGNSNQAAKFKMPAVVVQYRDTHSVMDAASVAPEFMKSIPIFNRDFIKFISDKSLEKLSRAEIDKKYGEPVSVNFDENGDLICFYRHLRSKQNYYKEGLFIVYGKDGTTNVIDSEDIKDRTNPLYVREDYRPILSGFTGLDWVDLPLAYFTARCYYLNREPISYITPLRLADNIIWGIIIGYLFPLLLPILISYAFSNLFYALLAPIKSLSNYAIEMITLAATAPIMVVVMVQLFENLPALWIIIAVVTIYAVVSPSITISGFLEFERCDACRCYDQITYTKTLIGVETSYRTESEDDTSVELSDRYTGPKRNIINDNTGDFDEHNERRTTTRRTTRKIKVIDSKFRYDFHCHNCDRRWRSVKVETDEKTVGSKTRKVGETVERVR